jgi:hypothetical protein
MKLWNLVANGGWGWGRGVWQWPHLIIKLLKIVMFRSSLWSGIKRRQQTITRCTQVCWENTGQNFPRSVTNITLSFSTIVSQYPHSLMMFLSLCESKLQLKIIETGINMVAYLSSPTHILTHYGPKCP